MHVENIRKGKISMKKQQLGILIISLGVVAGVWIAFMNLAPQVTTMEMYHLTTRWFFHAPIERVWEELITNDEQWKKAAARGNEIIGVGTIVDNEVKGELPYSLRFTTEITRHEPPFLCEVTSSGDLVGTGKWVLEARDDGTAATFYWDVGLGNPFLNLLSKVPFIKEAMIQNHDEVMEEDYRHTRATLEGVPESSSVP